VTAMLDESLRAILAELGSWYRLELIENSAGWNVIQFRLSNGPWLKVAGICNRWVLHFHTIIP